MTLNQVTGTTGFSLSSAGTGTTDDFLVLDCSACAVRGQQRTKLQYRQEDVWYGSVVGDVGGPNRILYGVDTIPNGNLHRVAFPASVHAPTNNTAAVSA